MAYTPNEWGVGNLITASKMNKIERQLVVNTNDLDDIRNGVTVPTYEEFETLRDDVAAEYDNTKTYAVGDYVIYNTQLYKCKTAITSVETWTAAHWDAVEVGEELQRIEGKNEEEVAELKSAMDETNQNLSGIETIIKSKNLYNNDDAIVGYLNSSTGVVNTSSTSYKTSDFVPVIPGKYITFSNFDYHPTQIALSVNSFCFYKSDKTTAIPGGTWKTKFLVPENAAYARVCFGSNISVMQIELTDDGVFTTYEQYFAPYYILNRNIVVPQDQVEGLEEDLASVMGVASDVTELQEQMADIAITVDYDEPYFSVYTAPYHDGYVQPDGTVSSGDWIGYTDKIPVHPGYILKGITTDQTELCYFRFVCAYNGNTPVSSAGKSTDVETYTVPDGIDYVVVSQRNTGSSKVRSVEISGSDEETSTTIKQNPMGYMKANGSMSDGDEIHVSENNVKNNVCVAFSGNITTFSKLYIGQRKGNSWKSCYIEIDSTNVVVHTDQGNATAAHGLTIGSDIQVLIETHHDATTSLIRVCSDGTVYNDTTPHRWLCDEGYAAAVSDGSTLTDCALSWTSRDINDPIWIFGDSYVSLYDVRWVYYLLQDGFDNVMINGYAGEQSDAAMTALRNLIEVRRPQYIFWIIGMNNGDGESAVNASWKSNYDLLINLCKKWNFTPVLGTIPNVPTVNNTYKNAIIRASGYRYVDFAKAVDPDEDGTWISGTLSNDGIHPTKKGAIVLYQRALADFPELMSY